MSDNKTLVIDIQANNAKLSSGLKKSSNEIQSFASRTRTSLSNLNKNIGNALSFGGAAGIGAGIFSAVKNFAEFDKSVSMFGINNSLTSKEIFKTKENIQDIAIETGIARESLIAYSEELLGTTGDINFVSSALHDSAIIARGTATSMSLLADVNTALKNSFNVSGNELMNYQDIIDKLGEKGALTYNKMASVFSRLATAGNLLGVTGKTQFKEYMAFIQTIAQNVTSPEMLTTGVEAFQRTLSTKNKQIIEASGFNYAGKSVSETVLGIISGIENKNKSKNTLEKGAIYSNLFGEEGSRALNQSIKEFRENNGQLITSESLMKMNTAGSLLEKYKRASNLDSTNIEKAQESLKKIGDTLVAEVFQSSIKTLSDFTSSAENMKQVNLAFSEFGKILVGIKETITPITEVLGVMYKSGQNAGVSAMELGQWIDPRTRNAEKRVSESLYQIEQEKFRQNTAKKLKELPTKDRYSFIEKVAPELLGMSEQDQYKGIRQKLISAQSTQDSKYHSSNENDFKKIVEAIEKGFKNSTVIVNSNINMKSNSNKSSFRMSGAQQ